jgi:hybrid cluster-associated redox disulfide protein
MKIQADTKITDALKLSDGVIGVFRKYGLDCPTCKGAAQDSIEKAAINNGLDTAQLVKELNESIKTAAKK